MQLRNRYGYKIEVSTNFDGSKCIVRVPEAYYASYGYREYPYSKDLDFVDYEGGPMISVFDKFYSKTISKLTSLEGGGVVLDLVDNFPNFTGNKNHFNPM